MQIINPLSNYPGIRSSALKMIVPLLLLCHSFLATSQTKNNQVDGYQWFDHIVGAKQTNLFNGIIEVEKFRMGKEKHKFYRSHNFHQGTLLYEGQAYYLVPLKYDLYEDVLLINGGNIIRLENDKIDGFFIENTEFVKLRPTGTPTLNVEGFFELLNNSAAFKIYKKHKKIKLDRLGDRRVYHEFKDDNRYIIFYKNKYHQIETKKDLIAIFPTHKKQLNKYRKKSAATNSKEDYLLLLLEGLNDLLINEKTPGPE